jgi:hypothetical protein
MAFLYRQEQIARLSSLIGQSACPVPAIFIYGVPYTGKTAVVEHVLRETKVFTAFVDCQEVFSPKLLFEGILEQCTGEIPSQENGYKGVGRCDHMSDFLRRLVTAIDRRGVSQWVIVLLFPDLFSKAMPLMRACCREKSLCVSCWTTRSACATCHRTFSQLSLACTSWCLSNSCPWPFLLS